MRASQGSHNSPTLVSCPINNMAFVRRSKWAAGKGAVSAGPAVEGARPRRLMRRPIPQPTGQPSAHFYRNPPGRGQLAVFPRCSLDPYESDMGASLAP